MSGPAIHNIVGWNLADAFEARGDCDPTVATALRSHPAHLSLGTQGPDFLFFNLDDWGFVPTSVPEIMLEVSDTLIEFKAMLLDAFPVLEDVWAWADDATGSSHTLAQIRDMLEMLKGVVGAFVTTLNAAVKRFVLDLVDVYRYLVSPVQACEPAERWWWFDVLHYRKTGQFVQGLLDRARTTGDDALLAYAVGYLSHVASDTVGHPYVNTIVRGPYRAHGQRHKVVENFQDVWAYAQYHDSEPAEFAALATPGPWEEPPDVEGDLASSQLHKRQFIPHPESSSLNEAAKLPDDVATAFVEVAAQVYAEDGYKPLTREDVDNAYRRWYSWFRNATETGTIERELPRYEPPGRSAGDAFQEFLDEVGDVFDAIGDLFSGNSPGLDGLLNMLEELGEAVLSAVGMAVTAIDWLLSKLLELPKEAIRLVLEAIYSSLYDSYEQYRLMLALLGFAYPLDHQVTKSQARHFTDPTRPDATGRRPLSKWPYPMRAIARSTAASFEYDDAGLEALGRVAHLLYPSARPNQEEAPASEAGPLAYLSRRPDYYIDGPIPLNAAGIDALRTGTATGTAGGQRDLVATPLGNAVDLTVELFCQYDDGLVVPDVNLDGDRGYGSVPWMAAECDCADEASSFDESVTSVAPDDNGSCP